MSSWLAVPLLPTADLRLWSAPVLSCTAALLPIDVWLCTGMFLLWRWWLLIVLRLRLLVMLFVFLLLFLWKCSRLFLTLWSGRMWNNICDVALRNRVSGLAASDGVLWFLRASGSPRGPKRSSVDSDACDTDDPRRVLDIEQADFSH